MLPEHSPAVLIVDDDSDMHLYFAKAKRGVCDRVDFECFHCA
jgi:hypothetical protein